MDLRGGAGMRMEGAPTSDVDDLIFQDSWLTSDR